MDSGSKALEFLGLYEDDTSNHNHPSVSHNQSQVNWFLFRFGILGLSALLDFGKILEEISAIAFFSW